MLAACLSACASSTPALNTGKVERAIVQGMQEHAQAEAELVDSWLSDH